MKKLKLFIGILVVGLVVVILGGLYFYGSRQTNDSEKAPTTQTANQKNKQTKKSTSTEANTTTKESQPTQTSQSEKQATTNQQQTSSVFSQLAGKQFIFSSGAGAWSTGLKIEANGQFTGQYSDMDMGDVGSENPNGTQYLSNFAGQMVVEQQLSDTIYLIKIKNITYANDIDTQEVVEGIKRVYTDAHGLTGEGPLLLYLPNTPLSQIPDEYKNWIMPGMLPEGATTLGFYGIYNEPMQTGFVSY